MKGEKWYVKGSFTVEAACIMAAVLLSISMMIHQAARVRDETVGAMGLHEAVEKAGMKKAQNFMWWRQWFRIIWAVP